MKEEAFTGLIASQLKGIDQKVATNFLNEIDCNSFTINRLISKFQRFLKGTLREYKITQNIL